MQEIGQELTCWIADIIKGFACEAPASALEFVSTMADGITPEIEEDGVMTTQHD